MSDLQHATGSRSPAIGPAAAIDLDLAFSAAEGLPPELLQAAGAWLDPLQAEDAWQALLAHWLARLLPELPPELRTEAYSLGLSLVNDAEIAALNCAWRRKQGPTDVLAFAAQEAGLEQAAPLPPGIRMVEEQPTAFDSLAIAADAAAPALVSPGEADPADADRDDDPDDGAIEVEQAAWQDEPLELGDIVVSVETAARQASEHGHSLVRELLFLACHGLLHLLGWDHPDEASLAAMLARQEGLLAQLPVPGAGCQG